MATFITENIISDGGLTGTSLTSGIVSGTSVSATTFYGDGSNITGISSSIFTGGTVTGTTTFTNGLTANTISGGTFFGDGSGLTNITSNFVGGTVNGGTNFTGGLTANTISATTISGNTLYGDGVNLTNVVEDATSDIGTCPTTTSTETITHNLGRTPKKIRIYAISTFLNNASATPTTFSFGWWTSSGNRCVYIGFSNLTTNAVNGISSNTFAVRLDTTSLSFITGAIQNVNSTTFDISWVENGTALGRVYLWEAD